jgi:DNA-binding ferritin-like protein
MTSYHATHEPLFLRERVPSDLFTEKVAAALSRVPDDEKKWPAHVFSELCKEFPYMTQYDIEIVIDRMDPEAGAALGYAQVQNKTQSRPQEAAMAAGNVIRVPIIIKDRRLQKFYIFEAGGQTYPMGESRIQQAMLNPLVFDTDAARVPQSPGLLDQIYPPGQQRTGFGRVSDPVSMGLTKLNSVGLRGFLKLARTPELADAYAGHWQESAVSRPGIKMPPAPMAHDTHVPTQASSSVAGPRAAQVQAAPPTRGPAVRTNTPPAPSPVPVHKAAPPAASTAPTAVLQKAHVAPRAETTVTTAERAATAATRAVPAAEQAAAKTTGGLARHLTGRNALLATGAVGAVAGGGLLARHLLKGRSAEKAAEHTPVPDPGVVAASLQPVLSALLALHQLYYFAHWTSQGEAAYSAHQLFTRLYEGVQEDFDSVAERIVGHGGNQAMDPAAVFAEASAQSAQWIGEGSSIFAAALAAEQAVQEVLMNAYGTMDQSGGLSLGIDDMLMAIASKHETNQYLLKQHDPGAAPQAQLQEAEVAPQQVAAPAVEPAAPPPVAAPEPTPSLPPKTASLRAFLSRTST